MTPDVATVVRPADLAAGAWSIEPGDSTARFRVRDKLIATCSGTIPVRSGTVRLGPGGAVESARLEMEVPGVDTGNGRRDRDLRKPGFLDADHHPTIVVTTGPVLALAGGWQITAGLTARGRTVPVDLQVTPIAVDAQQTRVRITGRLDRSGLGMKVPTFIVGRMIDIEVDAVFRR